MNTAPTEPDRRRDILQAALRVFSSEGIHKASIKRIAAEAGLKAPSLIYHYFKDKDDLVQAVVADLSPAVRQAQDPEALMEGAPETVLRGLMHSYYSTLDHPDGARFVRLFFSEAVRNPKLAERFSSGQISVVNFVRRYLTHQISKGNLREHNVEASARAFLGMMFAYTLSREILPHYGEGMPERDVYIETVISTFLRGLEP